MFDNNKYVELLTNTNTFHKIGTKLDKNLKNV